MNYLGHAFLSFGDEEILAGNMMGDHVKGKLALAQYPSGISKGVIIHRKIDSFADNHSATTRAKLLFREDYRLYSGAIMDTLYDHFLANDPKYFPTEDKLLSFTHEVYKKLDKQQFYVHPNFAAYYPYMKQQNWLYNYRTFKGMERSLQGLAKRAAHIPPIEKAYEIFITNYYTLNQCYFELIDDIIRYTKNETK